MGQGDQKFKRIEVAVDRDPVDIVLNRRAVIAQFGPAAAGYPHEYPAPVNPACYEFQAAILQIWPKPFLKVFLHYSEDGKCC